MPEIAEDKKTDILFKGLLVATILLIMFITGFFLKKGFSPPAISPDITVVPTITEPTNTPSLQISEVPVTPTADSEQELMMGQKEPGAIEELVFTADPVSNRDTVWLIRLRFENAEILEVRALSGLMLPSCSNNQGVMDDKVCVDIANSSYFNYGDEVLVVKVLWGSNGRIFRSSEDGYYNGESLGFSNKTPLPNIAGVATTAAVIEFPLSATILLSIGSILVFTAGIGLYLVMKKDIKGKEQITQTIVMGGFVLMAIGSVVAAALFANQEKEIVPEGSVLTPTKEYVYVYISTTPWPTIEVTDTPLPTTQVTATPTISTYPQFLVIYVTRAVSPSFNPSPTPTPVTDNIYVTCGAIDVNTDNRIDYIDYPPFRSVYNHLCTDTPPAIGCGGKDTNADGLINYLDLFYFTSNYYPKSLNCTIY